MDKIILSGIEFYAYGGVTPEEQEIGQRYRADVELQLDLTTAAKSDSLTDTVSYAEVYDTVAQTAREQPFRLLESVAERVAERILARHAVESVRVRIEKLLPPIDGIIASAGVEIERKRS
ncbi:MAG: dihydroneopterin aldolase [Chloroflexota bacterium]